MSHFRVPLSHVAGTLVSRASVFKQEALLPPCIEHELAGLRKGTLLNFPKFQSKIEYNLPLSPHTSE